MMAVVCTRGGWRTAEVCGVVWQRWVACGGGGWRGGVVWQRWVACGGGGRRGGGGWLWWLVRVEVGGVVVLAVLLCRGRELKY
ncbi:hypothetical protein Hanom_Chr09g00787811 [Helianthus anomalus]